MNSTMKTNQTYLVRLRKFPIRAILGLEPLWLVLPAGGVVLYLLFKGMMAVLGPFAGMNPVPSYVLPLAYFLLAVFVLTHIWFLVSLWSSAGRLSAQFAKILVRILVLVAAVYFGFGAVNTTHFLENTFSSSPFSGYQ